MTLSNSSSDENPVNGRQTEVLRPMGPTYDQLANVIRWSGYTRQPLTEITRLTSQHFLIMELKIYMSN
jgi:hypothetical protein